MVCDVDRAGVAVQMAVILGPSLSFLPAVSMKKVVARIFSDAVGRAGSERGIAA